MAAAETVDANVDRTLNVYTQVLDGPLRAAAAWSATLADGTDVQTITFDEALAEILRSDTGSRTAAASEAHVMKLFHRGRVSIGKACALLRVPRDFRRA
jgi:hypothetical protein